MVCNAPNTVYWSKEIGASGKRGITFDRNASFSGVPFNIPCQQCEGCRLDYSLKWGIRCMHEKMLHTDSSFVTVTYDNEHVPEDGSLSVREHQLFMKRLRKKLGKYIRFAMCGEYGTINNRPHYHYLFLNKDFPDKRFYGYAKNGDKLYSSDLLAEIWPFGHNRIGEVTLDSCCYVTRYICDRMTGDMADNWYAGRRPEFFLSSRKPGIGKVWYDQFGRHSHLSGDFVVVGGKKCPMPRYYDNQLDLVDSARLDVLKRRRRRNAMKRKADSTPDRRRVRETVLKLRRKANGRSI